MCRATVTPTKDLVPCGRCFKPANPNDDWTNGWPLFGEITLGFPGGAFERLAARITLDPHARRKAWDIGHPAAEENSAQRVKFKWGSNSARWRLCYDCQGLLLEVVGEFFRYGDPVRSAQELAWKAERDAKVAAETAAASAVAAARAAALAKAVSP